MAQIGNPLRWGGFPVSFLFKQRKERTLKERRAHVANFDVACVALACRAVLRMTFLCHRHGLRHFVSPFGFHRAIRVVCLSGNSWDDPPMSNISPILLANKPLSIFSLNKHHEGLATVLATYYTPNQHEAPKRCPTKRVSTTSWVFRGSSRKWANVGEK